ncbi:MAG: GntR family transcriptional regulator [Spirochaetes bacterium]|nr:GntR family transcriptional regulator [Spirochaetota bacterium]
MQSDDHNLLYQRIAERLREQIRDGVYQVGAKIPSEEMLAKELDVSRPTIKSAVTILVDEGILATRPAVGSFVVKLPGAHGLVGYVTPSLQDPFHAEMVRELDRLCAAAQYGFLVTESGETLQDEQNAAGRMTQSGAGGVIISRSLRLINDPAAASYSIPAVYCGGVPSCTCDKVSLDKTREMELVMEHLTAAGVKDFAFASTDYDSIDDNPRYRAYAGYLRSHGIAEKAGWRLETPERGEEGGRLLMQKLIAGKDLPRAVVCYNDWTAYGVVREALSHGIRIPEDIMVTGFDDLLVSRYFLVPLTTVNYRIPNLASEAFGLLARRIKNPKGEPESIIGQGELVVRRSTTGV